ncbi:hypothetical protein [Methanobrevibacter woesei]|uniref:hypothetical protein n=2 Tax=Methanobrevibacter woesei TaxID=190976 RepID=UPI0023F0380B|nr:hypothetical protein [Methanobrevibacter woesei]
MIMNKNNVLVVILVVIIALIGITVFLMPSQEESNLSVVSNSSLYAGDSFQINLSDIEGMGIANKSVIVTLNGSDNSSTEFNLTTDEKGLASFVIDKNPGNYSAFCVFEGDENYTSSNTTQNLEVKVVVQADTGVTTSTQQYGSASTPGFEDEVWADYVDTDWIFMSEKEYASRFPVLYHERTGGEGIYDILN